MRRKRGRARLAPTVPFAALCLAAAASQTPAPAAAEGLGRILPGVVRPAVLPPGSIIEGRRAIARVLAPKLVIDGAKAAGRVAGLSLGANGGLLLAVLDDGTARLWDLDSGAQIGGAIGGGAIAGAVAAGAAVTVRRDGAMTSMRPGGRAWPHGAAPGPVEDGAAVLSADGSALAFRGRDGAWRVARGGRTEPLPGAVAGFRPVLSPDGARAVFLTRRGPVAVDLARAGAPPVPLPGCAGSAAATAGAFLSGDRLAVGDERGNICGWRLSDTGPPAPLFSARAHDGPVRAVAASRGGAFVATRGASGAMRVWSAAPFRRVAEFRAEDGSPGPLALDAARRWLFAGQDAGKVAVFSWRPGAAGRVATLVFTDDGWAAIDAAGRFDGSQSGVDSLAWAGAAEGTGEPRARPVDAFSENWFEPGLQAKLDDESPRFLTQAPGALPAEGYLSPPRVAIDPIGPPAADGWTRVVARLADPDYPPGEVAGIRLYHNGKLAPGEARADGARERTFRLRLLPGENRFAAVGVGPGGIEGPRAAATATGAPAPARKPAMRVVAAGIDDYAASLGPALNLRFARNDVETVAAVLRARAGPLFDGVDSAVLVDSGARTADIERHILQPAAPEKAPSGDDVLVVYLAGHGYALEGDEGREWYFLPWSAGGGTPRGIEAAAREHGLPARKLMSLLARADARRVFLVLDSCYSGAAVDEGGLDDTARKALRRIARVGGIHVLAAAQADETAIEVDREQHGALTSIVLRGMDGGADANRDGTVSVKELIAHADRAMPELSHRLFGGAIVRKPVGYSRGADFALAQL